MTSTPTIDADAAGITDVAHARTGSVVDRLIAPDVAATADTIVHVPVKYVVPHPRNRKVLDDDVADLVAEFKAGMQILNPLGVTAAAEWNANRPAELKEIGPAEFIITAGGHRRLRAAELAGLSTVPCIVRADFAGAEGRKAALLENLHRQDLDPFEEAEAFAELVNDYKFGQRALAELVLGSSSKQPHISKRLKLLTLPTSIREAVRLKKVTIADALEFATLTDRPELLDKAYRLTQTHGYMTADRAVRSVVETHERDQAVAAVVEQLTGKGIRVIDDDHIAYSPASGRACRLDGLGLTVTKHKKEPCHAAAIEGRHYGKPKPLYVCTDYKRHLTSGKSEVKADQKHLERAGSTSTDKQKAERRRNKQLRDVRPQRVAFVHQLLVNPGLCAAPDRAELLAAGMRHLVHGGRADAATILAMLGLDAEPGEYAPYQVDRAAKNVDTDLLTLITAASSFEATWQRWDVHERAYLTILERNGYAISDAEHEKLGDVQQPDGTWVAKSADDVEPDEVPTCRVCGCTDDEACDGGCTWVTDPQGIGHLCSGCADATEAGWVDPEGADTVEAAAG